MPRHPLLPPHPSLAISHRGGNSVAAATRAILAGADLLETDVHLYGNHLELRHDNRKGPFFWQGWRVRLSFQRQERLQDLLDAVHADALLFLDLKSSGPTFGSQVVQRVREIAGDRPIAVCGRDYAQLDAIVNEPGVIVFYSVGEPEEWDSAWERLQRMPYPSISLHARLATPELMAQVKAIDCTVVCWAVNTITEYDRVTALGVDGVTTDNLDLIRTIRDRREAAEKSANT